MRIILKFGPILACLALISAPATVGAADRVPAEQAPANKERFVPLEGGQNFRDLGGYRTSDGRTVKWGLIYRSGSMHGLTAQDFETLRKLGLRSVIDFRSIDERKREPLKPPADYQLAVYAKEYVLTASEIGQSLSTPDATPESTRAAFESFYMQVPFRLGEQYREMFAQLIDNRAPLVINCSAGKDRTGVAAALVLAALGVPRETIVEDYLLSNSGFKPARDDPRLARLPPDLAAILFGVEARYLNATFKALDARPGGVDGFLRDELGVGGAELQQLRALYLE